MKQNPNTHPSTPNLIPNPNTSEPGGFTQFESYFDIVNTNVYLEICFQQIILNPVSPQMQYPYSHIPNKMFLANIQVFNKLFWVNNPTWK